MKEANEELEEFLRIFLRLSKKSGLKYSSQREMILRLLFVASKHMSVADISTQIHKKYHLQISDTTIYRNLRTLCDMGVVEVLNTKEGEKRYEIKQDVHHDHLICSVCGEIFEFLDPQIESLQKEVAKKIDFSITTHVMTLYGVCSKCKK